VIDYCATCGRQGYGVIDDDGGGVRWVGHLDQRVKRHRYVPGGRPLERYRMTPGAYLTKPCRRCRLAMVPTTKSSGLCYFCEGSLGLRTAQRNVTRNTPDDVTEHPS
jgi:hypothetical protein